MNTIIANDTSMFFRNDVPVFPILLYMPLFLMVAIIVPFSAYTSWFMFREDQNQKTGNNLSKSTSILMRFYSAGKNMFPHQVVLRDAKTKERLVVETNDPKEMADKIICFMDKCCQNNKTVSCQNQYSDLPLYILTHDCYKQMLMFTRLVQQSSVEPEHFDTENLRFIDLRLILLAANSNIVDYSMSFTSIVRELYPWISVLKGGFVSTYSHVYDMLVRDKATRAAIYNNFQTFNDLTLF